MATLTALPDRTPVLPVRVADVEEHRAAGRLNIAAQLQEAWERGRTYGYAERDAEEQATQATGPRHLSAVPGGGAS